LLQTADQVMPPPVVVSLETDALTIACPVAVRVVGGGCVNAIDAGAVMVVVAVVAFATSAGFRL
jgi:hypothetical protein